MHKAGSIFLRMHAYAKGNCQKIMFVSFESTFKIIYENSILFCSLVWCSDIFLAKPRTNSDEQFVAHNKKCLS